MRWRYLWLEEHWYVPRYAQLSSQIGLSAVVMNHSLGVGEVKLADNAPRVAQVSKEELLKEFEDWGSEARVVLGSAETFNKWFVEVLYPHLETYVKGRIALLGDAVSLQINQN